MKRRALWVERTRRKPNSRERLSHDAMLGFCQQYAKNMQDYLKLEHGLRPIQVEALNAFITHVSRHSQKPDQVPEDEVLGVDRVYYKLPPGMGKTNIGIAYVRSQYIAHYPDLVALKATKRVLVNPADVPKTLFVVPLESLREQTLKRFADFAPELFEFDEDGKIKERTSLVAAIRSGTQKMDKPVSIISYPLYVMMVKNGAINPLDYDLLIPDEVHESLTEGRIDAAEKFTRALKLGLTATEAYDDAKQVKILLGTCLLRKSIIQAAEQGYSCGFKNILAYSQAVSLDDVPVNHGVLNQRILERTVDVKARTLAAVEIYANYVDPDNGERIFGLRGIGNCVGVKHAQHAAEIFNEALSEATQALPKVNGKNVQVAAYIYGGMKTEEKKELLRRHRSGEILLLFQAKMLGRGHDDDGLAVCLNLKPLLGSVVEAEQRGGRPMRNPNFAYVFDIIDNNKTYNPILFAEVAGGAFAFPQHIRKGSGTNPSPYPAKIHVKGIEEVPEIKVVCTQEELLHVVKEHGIRRANQILPKKPRNMLTHNQLCRELGLSIVAEPAKKLRVLMKEMEQQYTETGYASINSQTLSCGKYLHGAHKEFCVDKSHKNLIASYLRIALVQRPPTMLSCNLYLAELGIGSSKVSKGVALKQIFTDCRDLFSASKVSPVSYKGHQIECGEFKTGGGANSHFHISISAKPILESLLNILPLKPPSMQNISVLAEDLLKITLKSAQGDKLREIMSALEGIYDSLRCVGASTITYSGRDFLVGKFKVPPHNSIFCVDEKEKQKLSEMTGVEIEKPPADMKSKVEWRNILGRKCRPYLSAIFSAAEEAYESQGSSEVTNFAGYEIRCGKYRPYNHTHFYISDTCENALRAIVESAIGTGKMRDR